MLETSNFVHGSAMRSLSLVVSDCSLSGRGQGHVSNFYIVDLENLATASRLYTGDIHNSTVVGWFMTPIRQWKWLECITVECTFITHRPTLTLQVHNIDLFRTCRTSSSALLHGIWQDFNWHDASRGPSAIAEFLFLCTLEAHLLTDWLAYLLTILTSSLMACQEPMVTCSPPSSAPLPTSPPQSEARLTCEFCGKRDFIYKFARSRRFCSVTCSKRFSAYSMRKAPDGSVTGRPTTMSSKSSRSKASVQVCQLHCYWPCSHSAQQGLCNATVSVS